ncbi:MAG TPA: NAD(P)-binding domain-containing protein [Candidatus Krumholzibacteria bacterium]
MKVGVLGSGEVAKTLTRGFVKHGHQVTMGTRDASKLSGFAKEHGVKVGSFEEAARFGEVLVLAVRGTAAFDVLKSAGTGNISGKTVIDPTNPLNDEMPANGVLKAFTGPNESLMGNLQRQFPDVRFVKAFNCVGSATMVDPKFKEGKPTMFICGDDAAAKQTVAGILEQFGWEVDDMGPADAARAIEPLAILWCIPGFTQNDWGQRAFKVLR